MEIGSRITKICKQRSISLSDLAKRVGIPKSTLHGWTTGRKALDPEQIRKVACYFKVPYYELLFGEQDPFGYSGDEELEQLFHGDLRVTIHKVKKKNK